MEANTTRTVLIAVVFVLLIAVVNFRGVSESVKANIGLTVVEVTGLLIIIVIGAAALLVGDGDPGRPFTFKEGNAPFLVLGGAATAFYALIGFEDAVNMSEETQDPSRVFPRALFGGLLLAGIIYLLVAFTAALLVPIEVLGDQENIGPLLAVVDNGPLPIPSRLFAAIALIAVLNTSLINMIMASRVIYGMARQGVIPSILGRTHSSRRTPYVAIIFTTLIGVVLVTNGSVSDLADTTTALLLIVFTIVNGAVLFLRRDPVDHTHFHVPTIMPVLGAIVCPILLLRLLTDDQDASFFYIMGGLLVVGLVLGAFNFFAGGKRTLDASQLES